MKKFPRKQLAEGNTYAFPGCENSQFTIQKIDFNPTDGVPGVSLKWHYMFMGSVGWYICKSEEEFWNLELFKDSADVLYMHHRIH